MRGFNRDCASIVRADLSGSGMRPCRRSADVQEIVSISSILAILAAEQPELRRVARRFGEAEMAKGMRGQEPAARGALQMAALDQIGLDDVLDRISRLRQRGGDGFHPDRAAAVIYG